MASFQITRYMFINSRLIIHEVWVNTKSSFHRSIGLYLALNLCNSSCSDSWLSTAFILFPYSWAGTRNRAVFCDSFSWSIWHAIFGHYTCFFKILKGLSEITPTTSKVIRITWYQILWWQNIIGQSTSGNTEPVWEDFWSSKCPATSTLCLVSYRMNTFRPCSSRVERITYYFIRNVRVWECGIVKINFSSEKSLNLFWSHMMKWILFNLHWDPGSRFFFNLFNDIFIYWMDMWWGSC